MMINKDEFDNAVRSYIANNLQLRLNLSHYEDKLNVSVSIADEEGIEILNASDSVYTS